jgi:hypothetical protein
MANRAGHKDERQQRGKSGGGERPQGRHVRPGKVWTDVRYCIKPILTLGQGRNFFVFQGFGRRHALF